MNPFYTQYSIPPFSQISLADYEPAMLEGIRIEDEEIDAIIANAEAPTFENTIVALSNSGALLERVTTVFYNMLSAETSDELDDLAQKMSPVLSEHSNNISLNEKLWQRVKAVYDDCKAQGFVGLDGEQQRLLEITYKGFVRSGANLNDEDKAELRQLTTDLGLLTLQFSQNHLKETNAFRLNLKDEADLAGLPQSSIDAAKMEAGEQGEEGWTFVLQAPSYVPFMRYSARADLRKQMYMAYNTQCTHDNEYNNYEICRQLVNKRLRYAQLLGYKTYADFVLEERMAENADNVYSILHNLVDAYMPTAKAELKAISEDEVAPWDFSYYSNKLKERLYSLNSEMLRPYFELSKVQNGIFGLAGRLYGISFERDESIPVYHPDVEAYRVKDTDGKPLAVFFCDFFPRSTKKSGAWMTSFAEQYIDDEGVNHRPVVSIVTNFTKPTTTKPSLLTLDEVETFLHEFGHALHGMFANTRYKALSGTNVLWDFVELPSQFMENYSVEPEFLNTFAAHYETDEPMPAELIERIRSSRNFNVAYACMRQVSFGLLDMAYYTRKDPLTEPIPDFEKEAWKEAQVLPQIPETCMTVQFSHIMSGGYSAGYYSYKWAEVLDADAFSLFQQNGIFDKATALSFRDNVLSKGNSEHPMTLYRRFRGQEPSIDALLKRNGIKK